MPLDLQKAIQFLRGPMYDTVDKFEKESTRTGGNNYYFHSVQGLYYTVMCNVDISNAYEVLCNAVSKKAQFGKDSNTLYDLWADIYHPLWRAKTKTQFAFKKINLETWGTLTNGILYNHNATGSDASTSSNYLNVRCFYVIHKMLDYYKTGTESYLTSAKQVWTEIVNAFNDSLGGYVDSIADYREAYKHGIIKLTSKSFPELRTIGEYKEPSKMWDGNLQNTTTGGIYMRFIRDANGNIVNNGSTFENTESTAAIILGYGDYSIV